LKKPENTAYYVLSTSLGFFGEKEFKDWLDGVKKYYVDKPILLFKKYEDESDGTKVDLRSADDVVDAYIKNLFSTEYFFEGLKLDLTLVGEKKPEITSRAQSSVISPISPSLPERLEPQEPTGLLKFPMRAEKKAEVANTHPVKLQEAYMLNWPIRYRTSIYHLLHLSLAYFSASYSSGLILGELDQVLRKRK
jgi:hypothetical protein